ncbi:TRAFAC clade GTPase domain-containing protein [Dactylosporangium sp. CS-033363]|uniref:TRAFAC clade GTPase domain-containing protein n=1 Tax=Dactylosporangium sp. CS-033363 TaxID=3239935 RepID=UPI003D9148E7
MPVERYVIAAAGLLSLLVVMGTVLLLRRSRRPRVQRAKPGTITVAVVGFSGAGKTVLLGSSFTRLMSMDGAGVFVIGSDKQVARLFELQRETAGEGGRASWPAMTIEDGLEQWEFTVKVRTASSQVFDVLRIDYFDYPGHSFANLFRHPDDPQTVVVLQAFKSAHAVLGVIDGFKLRRFLDGIREEASEEDFEYQLRALLSSLTQLHRPVQLVLTKWDLLLDTYKLEKVVERLMEIEHFRRFAEFHIKHGVACRLIPVSAVGPGYAEHDGKAMVRHEGKRLDPRQVEMPLACALTPEDHVLIRESEAGDSALGRLVARLAASPFRLTVAFPFVSVGIGGGDASPPGDAQRGPGAGARPAVSWLYPRSHGKTASNYFANLTLKLDSEFRACRLDRYQRPRDRSATS